MKMHLKHANYLTITAGILELTRNTLEKILARA